MKQPEITFHTVSRETFLHIEALIDKHSSALQGYVDQLFWWNNKINLVSRGVSRETLWEHIRHSLLLNELDCFTSADLIVDAGTGGGLPGLPLAIINREKSFILNDIVSKKIWAVKQIAMEVGIENVQFNEQSIEDLRANQPFLLVSKHAFKIRDLWEMARNKPWTHLVFYKGLPVDQELSGINDPLQVYVHKLETGTDDTFYTGKILLIITR